MRFPGASLAALLAVVLSGCASAPAGAVEGAEDVDAGAEQARGEAVAAAAADGPGDALGDAGDGGAGGASALPVDPAPLALDAASAMDPGAPGLPLIPAVPGEAALAAGSPILSLDVGGRLRTASIHVPPNLPAGQDVPLLVMLHPAMTSGGLMQWFYGMDAQADARGFIVAYPDGTLEPSDPVMHTWNAGYCCSAGRDTGSADVEFIAALIGRLLQDYPVDARHVGVAGHSNGGMLAHRVAAERSDLVSSVMVVAGSIGGQESRHDPELRVATPAGPVSALLLHAKDDSVVAYLGGNPSGQFEPRRIDLPVQDAVDLWLAVNGLSAAQPAASTAGVVVRQQWTGGIGGSEVLFITTEGGHGWPGVPGGQPPFFRSPVEHAATPLVADFFLAHPRSG